MENFSSFENDESSSDSLTIDYIFKKQSAFTNLMCSQFYINTKNI